VGQKRKFIGLQFRGKGENRFAIGALVKVRAGGSTFTRYIGCGEGYLSCHPAEACVGVGDAEVADVEIRWPSGAVQTFERQPTGAWYGAEEGKPTLERRTFEAARLEAPLRSRPALLSEGSTLRRDGIEEARLIVCLASIEELEELEPLKPTGGLLWVSPLDLEAARRAVGSSPAWTVSAIPEGERDDLLGVSALLPCVLAMEKGVVKAKFSGVGAGTRAARWLAPSAK
jgi:hypothetical protein